MTTTSPFAEKMSFGLIGVVTSILKELTVRMKDVNSLGKVTFTE
jgi:hypothetical protein